MAQGIPYYFLEITFTINQLSGFCIMPSVLTRFTTIVFCLFLAGACSSKHPDIIPQQPIPHGPGEIADIRNIPQDLTQFTGGNSSRPLLDATAQANQMRHFRSSFFSPWHMTKTSVSRKEAAAMLDGKARGWKNGSTRWQDYEWQSMRSNANMASFPSLSQPGITLRATDLRELPTHTPRFTKPTPSPQKNPFDYFQYTRLQPGTPLLLCHRTQDGRWFYVENALASGWVDADDIAPVSSAFVSSWEGAKLGAFVQEHVSLGSTNGMSGIGTVLPIVGQGNALIPVRGNETFATTQTISLAPGSIEPMPVSMTPSKVAALGNAMLGQHYGWGGMLDLRDCSSTTRDLMAPFGIWLPRNSRAQGRSGYTIPLTGMSVTEKEKTILNSGVPYASLVVMRGHVVLYVGEYRGRPIIMHNIWGIRVDDPANDNRLIIGRNVVTSLTPGAELPNLSEGKTIGDRFHTLTILGNAHK